MYTLIQIKQSLVFSIAKWGPYYHTPLFYVINFSSKSFHSTWNESRFVPIFPSRGPSFFKALLNVLSFFVQMQWKQPLNRASFYINVSPISFTPLYSFSAIKIYNTITNWLLNAEDCWFDYLRVAFDWKIATLLWCFSVNSSIQPVSSSVMICSHLSKMHFIVTLHYSVNSLSTLYGGKGTLWPRRYNYR